MANWQNLKAILDTAKVSSQDDFARLPQKELANQVFKTICDKLGMEFSFKGTHTPAFFTDPYFDSTIHFSDKFGSEFEVVVRIPSHQLPNAMVVEVMAMQAFARMGKQDSWTRIGDDKYQGEPVVCE